MNLVKALIAGTAITLAAPAFAVASDWHSSSDSGCGWYCQTSGETAVSNTQLNFGYVNATTNANVVNAYGDVNASATAVGNTLDVVTMQNTIVDNTQISSGQISATLNANVEAVDGNVGLAATALCNGASVSTDPDYTIVNSSQECGLVDPSATVNANVANVSGGVGVSAMAIGNQVSVDSNAPQFPVTNFQSNRAPLNATANVNVANTGPVDISSTAVGNTAQVIHYTTGGY
jgi:hypothetical protein